MIRRPPRSTRVRSSAASDVYKRQELRVDLAEQGLLLPDGSTIDFDIDPFAKQMLLAGTDELGYLLSKDADIARWEAGHPPRIETRASA